MRSELIDFFYGQYCLFRNINRKTISHNPFAIFNIELTNRCPMKCIMCPRTYDMTRAKGFMDYELFKNIVDEYFAINVALLKKDDLWLHNFGESLLHPQFDKFIKYA